MLDSQLVTYYLINYGAIAIFLIVFLEYLSLPGFPAGVIMPVAGMCAATGGLNFGLTLVISILGALCGSWVLYYFGLKGSNVFMKWFTRKFPKQVPVMHKTMDTIRQKGNWGIFIARLIPAVRTIVSLPAGLLHINFVHYTFFSLLGIALWNLFFIGAGYLLGEAVFQYLPFLN